MTHEKDDTVGSQWGANLEASWFREVCVEDYDDLVHMARCTSMCYHGCIEDSDGSTYTYVHVSV